MSVPPGFGVSDSDLTEIVIPSDLRSAKDPEDRILEALRDHGFCPDSIFAIKLSLEEAMTNAVKHGNRNDGSKCVCIKYFVSDERAVIMVRDEGNGFCPAAVPDPTRSENLERPFGRGIMLIRSYMTKVAYSTCGNEVWMLKIRDEAEN
jgi:serine/threonine-protein kinase RsbW